MLIMPIWKSPHNVKSPLDSLNTSATRGAVELVCIFGLQSVMYGKCVNRTGRGHYAH